MPRYLGLDWDNNQLHVVSVTTARGGVRVERALTLPEESTLKPQEAEAAGLRLRDRLKDAKIAPAPLIACVSRDRVTLKELRYPATSEGDEATLVRAALWNCASMAPSVDLLESKDGPILLEVNSSPGLG